MSSKKEKEEEEKKKKKKKKKEEEEKKKEEEEKEKKKEEEKKKKKKKKKILITKIFCFIYSGFRDFSFRIRRPCFTMTVLFLPNSIFFVVKNTHPSPLPP